MSGVADLGAGREGEGRASAPEGGGVCIGAGGEAVGRGKAPSASAASPAVSFVGLAASLAAKVIPQPGKEKKPTTVLVQHLGSSNGFPEKGDMGE